MKKHRIFYLMIPLIIIIAVVTFIEINSDKYRKIESTDLSEENINGISLMEKCNESEVEKVLGKITKKVEDKNSYTYEYATQRFIVDLTVDKGNNIIEIGTGLMDNSLKTKKGITKNSTLADVENAYGKSFLKKKYTDFMGSGNGYSITYIDKNNKSQIIFGFSEYNDGKLSSVSLSKY